MHDPAVPATAPTDLVAMLRGHAERAATARACVWLADGEAERETLTYAELDRRARAVAARVQGFAAAGDCALVVHPPGLEFLAAFFGCLYAGVIAVPLPIPRQAQGLARMVDIARSLGGNLLLSTATTLARLERLDAAAVASLVTLPSEETDADLARAWQAPTVTADDVAYLQYTSGSTSDRKGVTIRHRNVIDNLRGIAERFGHHDASVSVNWLPHFHDLGLVSGILQPLLHGHLNVMLSPTAFVQQPMRWLAAISNYRGTYTNSPNYGYDLCVRRATPEHLAALDLASLDVALNGAEPVRPQTVDEFTATFAPCGLRATAMYPAYGLAEATLVVSGARRDRLPVQLDVDAGALERDLVQAAAAGPAARRLVGCGQTLQDTAIAIVDPASARRSEGVGEIWVRGPGVADGYWERPDASAETFGGRIAGEPDAAPWLRTGDLGFLRDGELFVTGRIKDLIIVRGANFYPQDIEWTIEQSHAAFRAGCGAVFAVDNVDDAGDAPRLVAVFEVERDQLRHVDADELGRLARSAIAAEHELKLDTLVLLRTGTVPRTSSGKIQRSRCRTAFLAGELAEVGRAESGDEAPAIPPAASAEPPAPAPRATSLPAGRHGTPAVTSADDLLAWLRDYADTRLDPYLMDERRMISPPVMLDFGNHGVLGLQVARSHGGLGLAQRDVLRVLAQLGAIDLTLAMMTIVHNTLGIGPIERHAPAALRDDCLPRLASGRELVAFAITEPGAGSNPQALAARALPDAGGWRLYGEKLWSGTAGWASYVNVFAQNVDGANQVHGVSGFVVPRATPGLRIGAEAMTLGMRGMVQNAIHLEGARVDSGNLLGTAGHGMTIAQEAMTQGRLHIGAACLGGMKRCQQLLLRYAARREIATGRLLDNPVLLERLAALNAATVAIEALVEDIADRLDGGREVPVEAYAVCKTAAPEWLWRAADDLVQFLGGRGYMEPNMAARLLRDARVARILEGPTETLTLFLGSRACHEGAGLARYLGEDLGQAALAARVAATVAEVEQRCATGATRFPGVAGARRYAYALAGEIATAAVLAAVVTARRADAEVEAWALARLDHVIADALARAATPAPALDPAGIVARIDGWARDIGDTEPVAAGADHGLDALLRRATPSSAGVASPAPPPSTASSPAPASSPTPATVGTAAPPAPAASARPAGQAVDAAFIERYVIDWVAAELRLPAASMAPTHSLLDFGVDSVTAVLLAVALEERFGCAVDPELVYEHPVIRALAAVVRDAVERGAAAPGS
ncbi:MAG: AMP-binding protein [Gammaproteobacteria bacterium]